MMGVQIVDMNYTDFNKKRHVRIDRASELWGNPFVLSDKNNEDERTEVLWKYTLHLLRNDKMLNSIPRLEGKTLACWCFPRNKCHGQILGFLLDNREFIAMCRKPSADRESIARQIFAGLGWEYKPKHKQLTLF